MLLCRVVTLNTQRIKNHEQLKKWQGGLQRQAPGDVVLNEDTRPFSTNKNTKAITSAVTVLDRLRIGGIGWLRKYK